MVRETARSERRESESEIASGSKFRPELNTYVAKRKANGGKSPAVLDCACERASAPAQLPPKLAPAGCNFASRNRAIALVLATSLPVVIKPVLVTLCER